jgi:GTP-binding protein
LSAGDELIARHLREHHKKTFLVVNKSDGVDPDIATSEFFALGFQHVHPIAAVRGRGVHQLLEAVVQEVFPEAEHANENEDAAAEFFAEVAGDDAADEELASGAESDQLQRVKIAIVGRPNVGKSTLVNRMLGEDRVVVFDMPGTTRDSIYIDYQRNDEHFTLIDTAGIRKRKNITEAIEKFSIVKTLQAIDDAHVVILVMDAQEGIVEQDLHLLGHVIEKGRALVVAINKWDGLDEDRREEVKRTLDRRMQFTRFATTHFISALHGSGVGNLYDSIRKAYRSATKKLSTPFLTRILEDAVASHQPPLVNGRRIKMRYAHAGGQNPPIIVIHGNQVDKVPEHYRRYLENTFREVLQLAGTPLRIEFKAGDNPYEGKRNTLTPRQQQKRKRLMRHLKKK